MLWVCGHYKWQKSEYILTSKIGPRVERVKQEMSNLEINLSGDSGGHVTMIYSATGQAARDKQQIK